MATALLEKLALDTWRPRAEADLTDAVEPGPRILERMTGRPLA